MMDIEELAKEAGWTGLYITWAEPTGLPDWSPYKQSLTVPVTAEQVERFARLVAERCAKVCDDYPRRDPAEDGSGYWAAEECANAIRQEFGL